MKLPAALTHMGLSVTGLVSYGLVAIVASLLLFHFGFVFGLLGYLLAIAMFMGWDAHRIANGKAIKVAVTHGLAVVASIATTYAAPVLLSWLG